MTTFSLLFEKFYNFHLFSGVIFEFLRSMQIIENAFKANAPISPLSVNMRAYQLFQ